MFSKMSKRMISLALTAVMTVAMFACCAFSASAEDTAQAATVEAVYSPLKNVTATSVNPLEENPEFVWGVYSNRDNRRGYYVCDNKTADGAINASSDETNENYVEYKAGGLYSYTDNTTNQIGFISRGNSNMWLAFTAPADGYYTFYATVTSKNNSQSSYPEDEYPAKDYVSVQGYKYDSASNTAIPLEGMAVNSGETSVSAELKAGDQIAIRGSNIYADSKGVWRFYVDRARVTMSAVSTDTENGTVTTNYDFLSDDLVNFYGDVAYTGSGSGAQTQNVNYSAQSWSYEAIALTAADAYSLRADFSQMRVTSSNQITILRTNADNFVNTDGGPINICYALGEEEYGSGPVVRFRYYGTNKYYYGIRLYYTVPEDGTAVLTGAYSLNNVSESENTKAYYRAGIIYASGADENTTENGDGTKINYKINKAGFKYTAAEDAKTVNFGEVKAGDVIVYEVYGVSGTNQYANLSTLSVALTTEDNSADINGDRVLNSYDATMIRRYLMGFFGEANDPHYDVYGNDGVCDIRDLVAMKKILAGLPV